MREILFRGKRMDNKEWILGDLLRARYFMNDIEQYFVFTDAVSFPANEFIGYVEVFPETVCQCTGVTDKNGTKIFEGDIVRIDQYVQKVFEKVSDGVIRFGRGFFFVGDGSSSLQSLDTICDFNGVFRGEVIGNIYDNPELLGGESE